jgi:hypothetical protein
MLRDIFWCASLKFPFLGGELDPVLECATAAASIALAENLLVKIDSEARSFRARGHTLPHEGWVFRQCQDAAVGTAHSRFARQEVHDREANVDAEIDAKM